MKEHTTSGGNIDDNLLGLTSKVEINIQEAIGVAKAEEYLLNLPDDVTIDSFLIKEIHKQAFQHLYDWAGKYRTIDVVVGNFQPIKYQLVPNKMYQFADQLAFRIKELSSSESDSFQEQLVDLIAYAHHQIVLIHPFVNGNGRAARLISNLLAYLNGFDAISLYHREGPEREIYVQAIKEADNYNYLPLKEIIRKELKK